MKDLSLPDSSIRPSRVRYGVLAFACVLSMITYLDRTCFAQVAKFIQGEFGLSDTQKGMLFTAFALAYSIFEVPTGWLGDVFGPRRTLIRIVLWWSLFTVLTGTIYPTPTWPWLAFFLMLCVRFLFGVGEAGAYPNIARAFHSWFPLRERGSAQGAVWMAGRFMGGVTPFIVLALLHVVEWRQTFWIFGGLGVAWCVAFWWWFRDRPEDHPSVNAAELAYIKGRPLSESAPSEPIRSSGDGHAAEEAEPSHAKVPWRRILGSANLWALCLMYFCGAYGWYFSITWLPDYLEDRFGVTEKTHGWVMLSLLRGAPLLLGSLACLFGGLLTDWFVRRTGDRKWGRRLFGIIGHSVCALCYFLSLFAQSPEMFVLAIALAAFWNDMTMGAAWASCLDIGKRYSGIVSGCMNTVGNMGGALAGFAGGLVLDSFGKQFGWQLNLISFGLAYVIAVGFWMYFDATRAVVDDD